MCAGVQVSMRNKEVLEYAPFMEKIPRHHWKSLMKIQNALCRTFLPKDCGSSRCQSPSTCQDFRSFHFQDYVIPIHGNKALWDILRGYCLWLQCVPSLSHWQRFYHEHCSGVPKGSWQLWERWCCCCILLFSYLRGGCSFTFMWEYPLVDISKWWLAFSNQDGIYSYKFPRRVLEISCTEISLFTLYSLFSQNYSSKNLIIDPSEFMLFPFAFTWLNASKQSETISQFSRPSSLLGYTSKTDCFLIY